MLLSWILRSVGFDNQQTENMLFHDMIPAFLEAEEGGRQELAKEINQLALGRHLRNGESIQRSIDALFSKIYFEFGATAFLPEVFASVFTNYLNFLSKLSKEISSWSETFNSYSIDLIWDNDKKIEEFGVVTYRRFQDYTNGRIVSGCLAGNDKALWDHYDQDKKVEILLSCLQSSPLLLETAGHAFLLSGFRTDKKFIINDSLNYSPTLMTPEHLLSVLRTVVMFLKISNNNNSKL